MCCFEQLFAMAPTYLRSPLTFGILPARCPFASVRGSLHLLSHLGTTVWALSWFGSPIQSLLGGPLETLRKAFVIDAKLSSWITKVFFQIHIYCMPSKPISCLPPKTNVALSSQSAASKKKKNNFVALTKSFPQLISRRSELRGRR